MITITKKKTVLICLCTIYAVISLNAQNPKITFDQFLGVNWQNPEKFGDLDCIGFVRDFHAWESSQNSYGSLYPDQCINVNPTNIFPLSLDYVYGQLNEKGIGVSPAMMYSIEPYCGVKQDRRRLPLTWGEVPSGEGYDQWTPLEPRDSPSSYVERADWMYHFLSRYAPIEGLNDEVDFKYCDAETYEYGKGFVRYVESWNEPDNIYWHPPLGDTTEINGGPFTPQEYAAMASMDYDAHENSILSYTDFTLTDSYNAGVKNLSEEIEFVMAAPYAMRYDASPSQYYSGLEPCHPVYDSCTTVVDSWIKPMHQWFRENRSDQKFIFDVVNLHNYSLNTPDIYSPYTYWISPERDGIRLTLENGVLAYMKSEGWREDDENYKELWISEFGYDTNEKGWTDVLDTSDTLLAPGNDYRFNYNGFTEAETLPTAEDIQAQWVARTYLELAAAGIDRAMVHHAIDDTNDERGPWDQYTGLRTLDNQPKKVWFYIYGLKNILNGYRFVADESTNCSLGLSDAICITDCIRKYRFENEEGNRVWAIWSPTECGKKIENTLVNVENVTVTSSWSAVRLAEPSIYGIPEAFSVENGNARLTITETPLFLIENGQKDLPKSPVLSIKETYCSGVKILVDIPMGENYDEISVWYGQYEDGFTPDFSAIEGNLQEFENHGLNNSNQVTINGLTPNTEYIVYVIPRNENGIVDFNELNNDGLSNCAIRFTTSMDFSMCKMPLNDPSFATIRTTDLNGYEIIVTPDDITLFDNQDINFCEPSTYSQHVYLEDLDSVYYQVPLDSLVTCGGITTDTVENLSYIWESWISYGGERTAIIEFADRQYINQFYMFDGSSAGLLKFEWSDDNVNWSPLAEYFTNGGQLIKIYDDGDNINNLDCDYDHILFGEWVSLTDIDNPLHGIKYLKITATNSDARISELFICGEKADYCAVNEETETQANCTSLGLKVGRDCALPTSGLTLNIQGSEAFQVFPITERDAVYPASPTYDEQLIPGDSYLETYISYQGSEVPLGTYTVNGITMSDDCDNVLSTSFYPEIDTTNFQLFGCSKAIFLVPDLPLGTRIETWTAGDDTFDSLLHPMQSGGDVFYNQTEVYQHPVFGKCIDIEKADFCSSTIYVAYRYITEKASSNLHKLSFTPKNQGLLNTLNPSVCYTGCYPEADNPLESVFNPSEEDGQILVSYDTCGFAGLFIENIAGVNQITITEWTKPDMFGNRNLINRSQVPFNGNQQIDLVYPNLTDRLDVETEERGGFIIEDLLSLNDCLTEEEEEEGGGNEEITSDPRRLFTFPSPTKDYLNIMCSICEQYKISDIHGRLYPFNIIAETEDRIIISTEDLQEGMYFIHARRTEGRGICAKFVVLGKY